MFHVCLVHSFQNNDRTGKMLCAILFTYDLHIWFLCFVLSSHVVVMHLSCLIHPKIATAPPGTQAASLDIERAYHNSPIAPRHKPYLAVSWNGSIYVGHVAVEGLATAGGIQGCPADALLDILHHHGIERVFKWVDDVVIFRTPHLSNNLPLNASFSYSSSRRSFT